MPPDDDKLTALEAEVERWKVEAERWKGFSRRVWFYVVGIIPLEWVDETMQRLAKRRVKGNYMPE